MKIFFALVTIIVILILAVVFTKFQNKQIPVPSQKETSSTAVQDQKVDIKASFTIITSGITRSFSARMYHNLSPDVYIQSPDPSVVHVKNKSTTWDDFFKTLPMKLTKDCLTTGDGETFCSGSTGTLRFYLNDKEDPDLLNRKIMDGDKALIRFG